VSFNIRLGKLFGADIHLHSTFFLFVLLFSAATVSGRGWDALPIMGTYYLAGFLSVLIHEYGHIFAARLHGVDCRKITLHGLGGLAHLDEELERPRAEFLVALAGPVTSLILAVLLWLASGTMSSAWGSEFLADLSVINLAIACFNLIPAYPLDGGRMLHAALRAVVRRDLADTVSSIVARLLGAGLVVLGLLYSLVNVAIIGVLLFLLAPSSLGQGWFSGKRREKPSDDQPPGASAADR
jgi:stage IV sporulation protein FB